MNNDSYEGLTIEKLKAAVKLLKEQSVPPEGDTVIFYKPQPPAICVMCGNSDRLHYTDPTHPLFNNNLEYLEWVDKNRVQ